MEKYRGLSPSEFFYRNREIAGFSNPTRALYQTVRELVENSLDATEMHGILPEIKVIVKLDKEDQEKVTVRVEDNGIGIPPSEIPNAFARVFYGSKYVLRQARGVFGLGVKMAVLYAQITTARPIYVKSSTRRSKFEYEYKLLIDIEKNLPIITELKVRRLLENWHGTIVELTLNGNWYIAKSRIEEYIRRTALIAPYAKITLEGPDISLKLERASDKLPEPPQVGKHHPCGVDVELLRSLIRKFGRSKTLAEFLMSNFDGVGQITARKFCEWAGFDPNMKLKELGLRDLERLANKMREFPKWRRPKPITLSPLGEELLKRGVENVLKPEFVAVVSRPPASYGGHPFIVEVALAYGGEVPESDSPLLLRFANRIPLLYDEGVDVSRKVIASIDWSIYKVKFPAKLAIVTHICSTKIPFKGVGKEAIADVPEVERELTIAIRDVARKLRSYLSKIERLYEVKRKEVTVKKYLNEVVRALSYVSGHEEKVLKRKLLALLRRELSRRGRGVNVSEEYSEEACS